MTEALAPSTYFSLEVSAAERQRIFEPSWQLVALRQELAQHQDFVVADLAGRSILVQNFDGALRGFVNVCSHRHARLRQAECGNGLLRCPYHGWTYNGDGVPVGIPGNADYFGLDREGRQALALRPVAVACCGDLVFARLTADGPDLATVLGAYAEPLAHLSTTLGRPFQRAAVTWAANWKIGVESALEGYHLDMIHPHSFRPMTGTVRPSEFAGPHSFGPTDLADEARASMRRMATRLGLATTERFTGYDHFFLFPNMMVIASAGTFLSLQVYEPTGPEVTRLKFWMAAGPSSKPEQRQSVTGRAIERSLVEFNDRVLGEDQRISEEVQHGKHLAERPARLGQNEDRIAAFHEAWRAAMEGR
ncbi:ring-hydroxylating oxygenase subunit alpha [Aliidongia dinghuensis]|uniref:Ring-hydroxylating oxygenase subunit alpha n=1 Tax=Aliidongia dinghuensis TaxID=1867774 RepID=A0A8J3E4G9_9PROT|nr:aromatic ring-hydroxylating dioxygenase subunit alpha [Aliidongia dinghuensis]GGF24058.1 ring-hydroxylating oxygenase subunit alpha [Aliidongia dinghuensis]